MVTAVKFAVTGTSSECDALLGPQTSRFLAALQDENFAVRRAALLTVNTMIRSKPDFVSGNFSEENNLLSAIYVETIIRKDLIRKVSIGPFKHIVDDGIPLRIAAFECLSTILDECIDKVEPTSFINSLAAYDGENKTIGGLADDLEVKLICQPLLIKAADCFPVVVTAAMEVICSAFAATIKTKLKNDALPAETQRLEECIRSVCRTVVKLQSLDPESGALAEFIAALNADERWAGMFEAAQ